MSAVAFDTLKLADGLEKAGFTREQATGAAKVLAESFSSELATKADLSALRAELKGDIASVKGDIAAVRNEVASVKNEVASVRTFAVQWIVGALLVNAGTVAAIVFGILRVVRP